MTNTRAARRPQRASKQAVQAKPSKQTQQVSRISRKKPKSNIFAQQKKAKYIQTWLSCSSKTQNHSSTTRPRRTSKITIKQLISDEVSSCEDPSDDETSSAESIEQTNLTRENIEFRAADELHRVSYDSRHEPGNEVYELDDFVVGDSEESEAESLSSEITALRKVSGCSLRPRPSVISVARRASVKSVKSAVELDVEGVEEVVEEIMDAMALFSRRCNRILRPRRFALPAEVLRDDSVRDVLEDVLRVGLGRLASTLGGSEVWVIGPKR